MFEVIGVRNDEPFVYSRVPFEHDARRDAQNCATSTGRCASIIGVGNDAGIIETWCIADGELVRRYRYPQAWESTPRI